MGAPAGGVFVPANLSVYSYAHQRPAVLKDPNGKWVEDLFIGVPSLGLGLWSLGNNVWEGNWGAAAVDAAGIVADGVAIATPGAPGGAGLGIKATREGTEAAMRSQADDVAAEIAEQGARQVDEATDAATPNIREVTVSRERYPESAQHIDDAVAQGHPDVLTIDRAGATQNRAESLDGIPTRTGQDRDEFPPAMFREGGDGASVRYIDPSDNRGAGACIGNQCRGLEDGTQIRIVVED